MPSVAIPLPDDIDALKAVVRDLRQQLDTRALEIESLKLQIAKLQRMQFGARSEKLDRQIGQLELRLEDLQADEGEVAVQAPAARSGGKRSSGRRPLPEHLPREDRIYEPETQCCPDCGGVLHLLGEDVSEQLEYVPGHWKVLRHRRPKRTCQRCEVIVQAAAPSRPIERGLPGPGLHAHVLVAKYCDHLPLYRQCDIYARDGVFLSRSTLADWVGQAGALLRPLVAAIRRYVLASGKVHSDDTPVAMLDPGRGRTKTGRRGPTFGTTGLRGRASLPRPGTPTARAARGSIPKRTWRGGAGRCRPMPSPGTTGCMLMAPSSKWVAGPTPGASSTTCTSRRRRR